MQMPLGTGCQQPLSDEHPEDAIPARALARGREVLGEKRVQTELTVEFQREPATAPLPRTAQGELIQPDLHHARVINGRGPIMREEGDLGSRAGIRAVSLEGLAPGRALAIIDLAQVEHLALSHASVVQTLVFDDRPVGVFLAIFFADLRTQKHNDRREYTPCGRWEEVESSLQANLPHLSGLSLANPRNSTPKIVESRVQSAKSG